MQKDDTTSAELPQDNHSETITHEQLKNQCFKVFHQVEHGDTI